MAGSQPRRSHLRSVPVQQRSTETVERILTAALELLDSGGLSAFNTNAVAAAAGVNVGTLYHYFPDKESVLRELFERTEAERLAYLRGMIDTYADVDDVEKWVTEVVRTLARMRRDRPGAGVLRSALRVVPELQELEDAQDAGSAGAFAAELRRRHPGLSRQRTLNVARLVIATGVTALDRASEIGTSSSAVERELVGMISAYLSSLDDG